MDVLFEATTPYLAPFKVKLQRLNTDVFVRVNLKKASHMRLSKF